MAGGSEVSQLFMIQPESCDRPESCSWHEYTTGEVSADNYLLNLFSRDHAGDRETIVEA